MGDAASFCRVQGVLTLVLLRHGATAWNESGYCQGRRDVPLADAGRAQALRLRDAFAGRPFDLVLASPLGRAVETARIATGRNPSILEDLMEIDRGHWEGHVAEEIRRRWGKLHKAWYEDPKGLAMPGGESFDELWDRAGRVLGAVEETGKGLVLACGHKAINRVIIARALGRPTAGVWQIPQPQACRTELARDEDSRSTSTRWECVMLADVSHLPRELRSDS